VVLADRVAAFFGARQKQERFLNLRRELQQVHDLGDAGAADVAQPRQVGLIRDLAFLDQPVA
jgi:hypothetical protein